MARAVDDDQGLHTSRARRASRSLLPAMLHFSRITTLLALILIGVAAVTLRRDRLTWGIPIGVLGVTLAVVAGTLTQSLLLPKIAAKLFSTQKTLRGLLDDRTALANQVSGLREDRDELQRRLLAIEADGGGPYPDPLLSDPSEGKRPAEGESLSEEKGPSDGETSSGGGGISDEGWAREMETDLAGASPESADEPDGVSAVVDVAVGLVMATGVDEIYQVVAGALEENGLLGTVIVSRDGVGSGRFVVAYDTRGDAGGTRTPLMALHPPQLADLILLGLGLARPLWIEDLTSLDPGLSPELSEALVGLGETGLCRALALIPFRGGRGGSVPGGAAVALFDDIHWFGPAKRQVHELLCGALGMSLARTRSWVDLRAGAVRQQHLSTIGGEIRRSADVESVLQVSLRELGRALGASDGEIRIDMAALGVAGGDSEGGLPRPRRDDDGSHAEGGTR